MHLIDSRGEGAIRENVPEKTKQDSIFLIWGKWIFLSLEAFGKPSSFLADNLNASLKSITLVLYLRYSFLLVLCCQPGAVLASHKSLTLANNTFIGVGEPSLFD